MNGDRSDVVVMTAVTDRAGLSAVVVGLSGSVCREFIQWQVKWYVRKARVESGLC